MAGLFLSDYQRSMLARSWRDGIDGVYSLALGHLAQDLEDPMLSPWEKLTGLIPIMDYEVSAFTVPRAHSHHASSIQAKSPNTFPM